MNVPRPLLVRSLVAKKLPFQWDHGRDKNGIDGVDFS
jgi:hypothetical protein